jgi:hypothetical protein
LPTALTRLRERKAAEQREIDPLTQPSQFDALAAEIEALIARECEVRGFTYIASEPRK